MRPNKFDIDPVDADADGLASGNSSAGSTVTLDGVLTSGGTFESSDGLGRLIDITDAGADDQSGATYTLTGTDANDLAITEAITGPGVSSTVTSTKFFKTITSVAISSPAAGSTVDIGTNDEVASKTFPLNWRADEGATVAIMGASGTFQADIQETFDDVLGDVPDNANFLDKHTDKTGDGSFTLSVHARGVRVHTDSFTSGAEFQFHILQSP